MAFQMTHMEVAYRLLKKWDWVKYPAEFIVGSVAPDSVHMRDNYDVSMKIKTHLFEDCGPWGDTQDYDHWIENIRAFWKINGENEKDEKIKTYVAAICVHCLTDYCNDRNIWRYLQYQYMDALGGIEVFKTEYYPEALGIDKWLFKNSKNTEVIVDLFRKGECIELNGLLCEADILKQKDHMLNKQYAYIDVDISKYKYLSGKFIEDFLDNTVEAIDEWMKNWEQ